MLLEVKQLTKSYNNKKVVDHLDFELGDGQVVGLVGGNGVGKTTTMRLLVGLTNIEEGSIRFNHMDIFSDFEKYISKIGVMIESPAFYPYMSGMENLRFANRFYDNVSDDEITYLIELFQMQDYIHKKAGKYSFGMKQKLGICRAFLNDPDLIMLDEPTNGLDVDGKIIFWNEVRKRSGKQGISFLISSHNLTEVETECDRILFMTDGKMEILDRNHIRDNGEKYRIITKDVSLLYAVFSSERNVKIIASGDNWMEIEDTNEKGYLLNKLCKKDIPVYEWSKVTGDLQSYYLNKNGKLNEEENE